MFSMINIHPMSKADAIAIFGTAAELSRAIGVTRSAIAQWPDRLDQGQSDRVVGAAVRLGLTDRLPAGYAANPSQAA